MAYDDDGTVVVYGPTTGPMTTMSAADITTMNRESNSNLSFALTNGYVVAFIFPELRDIAGIMGVNSVASKLGAVYTSPDTTNGISGTWTNQGAITPDNANTYGSYRDSILSLAVTGIRGVWAQESGGSNPLQSIHLYGKIAAGETPDRLLYVDSGTSLEFTLPIDYGDVPRGAAEDRTLVLRNNSGSLTASSVTLTAEDLYLGSGAWYTMSEGSGFSATLALASSIGAGADSPTITVRRIIPDAENVGLHAGRLQTVATFA